MPDATLRQRRLGLGGFCEELVEEPQQPQPLRVALLGMAKAEAMIASLQKDLASKSEENRKQQAQLAEAPKSGACLVM